MCTDHDSRPPIAPISGAAIDAGTEIIKSGDGADLRVFVARPEQSTGAGILILPDVRGLHPFFEELASRFAERGITAVAMDYFCRTAGTGKQPEDFDYQPHLKRISWDNVAGDIKASVAHLRVQASKPRSTFATGFCMGGRLASDAATLGLGLAGAIPFYGWPVGPHRTGSPAPADVAKQIECDLLLIYGGADQGISESVRKEFDDALDKAGVKHETVVYPGAPHSFFDRKAEEFQDASSDAWDKTLAFIRRHTAGQPFAPAAPAASSKARVSAEPADPRVEIFEDMERKPD
jgi:carboxymethylenebutenolidase